MTPPPLDLAKIMRNHETKHFCLDLMRQTRGVWDPILRGECLPYRLAALAQEQTEAIADAWDEGFTKAGRLLLGMDDEDWPPAPNPYRAALADEQPHQRTLDRLAAGKAQRRRSNEGTTA